MGRIFKVVCAALAPAVIAAGIAVAAQDHGDGSRGRDGDHVVRRAFVPGPPPFARDLTYGELHVRRNGENVVVRVDRGKVASATDDSITIEENDGSSVTIPVDGDTRVLTPRRRSAKPSDLEKGQLVLVHRTRGDAAEVIAVVPKRLERFHGPRGMRHAMPLPPPGPPGPPPGM